MVQERGGHDRGRGGERGKRVGERDGNDGESNVIMMCVMSVHV